MSLNMDFYYRIILDEDTMTTHVVCMQWPDEDDYDQTHFVNSLRYPNRELALIDARSYNRDMRSMVHDRHAYLRALAEEDRFC